MSCSTPQNFSSSFAVARAAVSGADRIDEDEVGHVEPGARIVGERGRRPLQLALGIDLDDARADAAEMEIGRGSAGAAVEYEGERALGILRVARIGDIEHVRRRFAACAGQGKRAGFRRVVERHASDLDGVVGDGGGRQLRGFRLRFGLSADGGLLSGLLASSARIVVAGGWLSGTPGQGRPARRAERELRQAAWSEQGRGQAGSREETPSIGKAGRVARIGPFSRDLSSGQGALKARWT